MSRRSRIKQYQVLNAADTTTSPLSVPTDISSVDFITYQIEIDPTVDAILNVYFCNSDIFDTTKKEKLDFGLATPLNGAAETKYMVPISNRGFKWLCLEVEDNGGNGNASAWITGTVVGA